MGVVNEHRVWLGAAHFWRALETSKGPCSCRGNPVDGSGTWRYRTETYQLRDDKRPGDQRRSPGQSLETGKSRGEDRKAAQQHLEVGSGRGARQAKETEQETPGKKEDSQEFSG